MFLFLSFISCLNNNTKPKKVEEGIVIDRNVDGNEEEDDLYIIRDMERNREDDDDDGFGLPFNDSDPNGPCGPNAKRENGKCICLDGFTNGHPYTAQGCFKCSRCSKFADCIDQEICKCHFTHEGNGLHCESKAPIILAFKEIEGRKLNITVDFKGDQELVNGSCILNDRVMNPIEISANYIVCPLMRILPETSKIIIAMNNLKSDASTYKIMKQIEVPKAGQWITLASFVVVMIFVTIGLKASSKNTKNDLEPLISKDGQSIGRRLDI